MRKRYEKIAMSKKRNERIKQNPKSREEMLRQFQEREEEQRHFFKRLDDYNGLMRSKFIYLAVLVEQSIEICIVWHFCSDRGLHAQFISFLFRDGQITFSQKILILKKIMRNAHSDLYETYRPIFNHLELIRKFRNKLAHSRNYTPWDFGDWFLQLKRPEMGLYFEEHKDGQIVKEFKSEVEVDALWEKCVAVRSFFSLLPIEMESRSRNLKTVTFSLAMDSMSRLDSTSYSIVRAAPARR